MKYITIALSLGCAAVICGVAVQSDFSFVNHRSHSISYSRSLLDRSWLVLLKIAPERVRWMPGLERDQAQATAVPSLSKAQTLALISWASAKYRVSPAFVTSIVAAESNFDSTAVSSKGAIGLMQLMPETAREFGADPSIPEENVDAGTHYLHYLLVRYQNTRQAVTRAIAAYNAGPGMVDRYRGVPPFRETRSYVTRVLAFLKRFAPSRGHDRPGLKS